MKMRSPHTGFRYLEWGTSCQACGKVPVSSFLIGVMRLITSTVKRSLAAFSSLLPGIYENHATAPPDSHSFRVAQSSALLRSSSPAKRIELLRRLSVPHTTSVQKQEPQDWCRYHSATPAHSDHLVVITVFLDQTSPL
jgi:hypothetical protein